MGHIPCVRHGSITQVLNSSSDEIHSEEVIGAIYEELRACVRGVLARENRCGSRPQANADLTMVVHECWLKLQRTPHWDSRAHFFGAASRATRQILIDMARTRRRRPQDFSYDDKRYMAHAQNLCGRDMEIDAVELDAALNALAQHAPRAARIGGYRLFGDLSTEIIAEIEGVSPRTVQRDWLFARAWLASRLGGESGGSNSPPFLSDSHTENA